MARTVCFFVLIALITTTVFAQTCTTYVLVDPFDSETSLGINGLKAEDFDARMGSKSLPIISATQKFNNRVLVLVEISGSSNNTPMLGNAQGMADLVRRAPAGRPIAFGVFAEEAFISKEFSADPQTRSSAIDGVLAQAARLPGKAPAIFDSLHQAIGVFGPHQPGDTIILLTDGHDSSSKRNPSDLEKEFAANGTRLVVDILPKIKPLKPPVKPPVGPVFRQDAKEDEDRTLKRLTSATGGAYRYVKYTRLLEFAWSGYLLGIQTPATLNKPKEWELHIKDSDGKINKDALIFHPWRLTPCGSLTAAAR